MKRALARETGLTLWGARNASDALRKTLYFTPYNLGKKGRTAAAPYDRLKLVPFDQCVTRFWILGFVVGSATLAIGCFAMCASLRGTSFRGVSYRGTSDAAIDRLSGSGATHFLRRARIRGRRRKCWRGVLDKWGRGNRGRG